jgi:hypothetical protein
VSRSSGARQHRRSAVPNDPPSVQRWHIAPACLPRVPVWARFGEQAGAEHEAAHAAIHDALAVRGPSPDDGALVVVGIDLGDRVLVSFEPLEDFASKVEQAGHADVASAIRRPVQSGMVRTLAVSRLDSFQTGALFWPSAPINSAARGAS